MVRRTLRAFYHIASPQNPQHMPPTGPWLRTQIHHTTKTAKATANKPTIHNSAFRTLGVARTFLNSSFRWAMSVQYALANLVVP